MTIGDQKDINEFKGVMISRIEDAFRSIKSDD
jgi:hypothetical protein